MKTIPLSKTHHVVFWVGWLFFGLVLAALLRSAGAISWKHALALAAPLSAMAQISAMSAGFSSKTTPLTKTPLWRLLLTHVTAAVVLTYFWVSIGEFVAHGFDSIQGWAGLYSEYARKTWMLYAAGVFYYLLSVAFNYAIIAQKASSDAQARALESSMRAREAELTALKAQINPHFLYNSLNSISALTSIDPARAREMCVSLADFLRMTLGMGEQALIPLREELALLEKYCAIEKVRFGDRLTVQEEIQEETKECAVPPL